jgi:Retrotransposon gag protein/Zinc knuckle
LQPVGINPIQARSTTIGGGESISATVDTAQLLSNAVKVDGQLKGRVPEIFDGDRTKTQNFMNSFDIFWMTNEDNNVMKIPYKRSTFFLGLISGPKVDDWVNDQACELRAKTTRRNNPIARTDDSLWTSLQTSFKNAFAFTGQIEQAKTDLARLEMEGDDIDNYIAKFENLLRKAAIPRTDVRVMDDFTDGLKKWLHKEILREATWPTTLDEWEEAARRQVRRNNVFKASMGNKGNYHLSTRRSKWQGLAQRALKPNKKDNYVPMEVDAASVEKAASTKDPEKIRLQKEGRCFKCQKQGHIKRNCPEWKGKAPNKPPPYEPKARTTTLDSVKEEAEEPGEPRDLKNLAQQMATLGEKEKEDLFGMMMEESDF